MTKSKRASFIIVWVCLLSLKTYAQEVPQTPPKPENAIPPIQAGKSHFHLSNKILEVKPADSTNIFNKDKTNTTIATPAGLIRKDTVRFKIKLPYER